jgi:L-ascorbate metabolism protein UlaG (beta-lactamase superfamily)
METMTQATPLVQTARLRPELLERYPTYFADPRQEDGSLACPWYGAIKPPAGDILRWQLTRNPYRERKRVKPALGVTPHALARFEELGAAERLMWDGHATFFLQLGGARLLIDPVFGRAAVVPRAVPSVLADTIPEGLDALLLTHGHYDHFDVGTIKRVCARMSEQALVVVPAGLAVALPRVKQRVVELWWWQQIKVRDVVVTFVPSQHWHRRGLNDFNRALWGGWHMQGECSVYHCGDTGWCDVFEVVREVFGAPDVALLPLGAYEPRWFMGPQHMDPEAALRAFEVLGAGRFVGMHWGTFDLSDEPLDLGPEEFYRILGSQEHEPSRYHILKHGQSMEISG